MTSRTTVILLALAGMAMSVFVHAQTQLDSSLLGKPPVDAWPTYHGDYSGRHYSSLNQINQSTVKRLTLSWLYRANTNTQGAIAGGAVPEAVAYRLGPGALAGGLLKATPLAVNGVLYMSAPDHAWAIDAHSGREIWHFFWRTKGGDHIGNRGLGMYGNWLYFETPDGYVVSLDAATGKERWHKQIVDVGCAGHHPKSRHSRDGWRRARRPGLARIARPRHRGDPVEVVHDATTRRAGRRHLARCVRDGARRRDAMDAGHLRPRAEPDLRADRQSEPCVSRRCSQGRESLHRVDRRAECGHGEDGVVLPIISARHA
jgi:hypothetical protein